MGQNQSQQQFVPCQDNKHRQKVITCMNPHCAEARRICRNQQCGFVSSVNLDIWLCILCKIAEKNLQQNEWDEQEILERPSLKLEASVTFNRENNRFQYTESFFDIVAIEDEERERMSQRWNSVVVPRHDPKQPIAPEFSDDSIFQVVPDVLPAENGLEPLFNYQSVRKISSTELEIVHKNDEQKNIHAQLQPQPDGGITWQGLPRNFVETLNGRFAPQFQRNYPDVALRAILVENQNDIQNLRPSSEITCLLQEACPIKRENPALKYKIIEKIGRGGFGTIFKVMLHEDQQVFALKFTSPQSRAERQDVINECSLISFLNSDQLIKCEDVYDFQDRLWVFLELMEGGDMTKIVLDRMGNFSEDFIKWSLFQTALGLRDMHKHNVLHRDIKSDNILVRANGDIKLADMGFSVFLSEQKQYRQTQRGTPSWISPEIAQGVTYSKEVDIWAFGCFAFELASGNPPFHDRADDMNRLFDAITIEDVPRIPSKWSDAFADFVAKCFIKPSSQRWSIEDLLNHEFMVDAESAKQGWLDDYAQWANAR